MKNGPRAEVTINKRERTKDRMIETKWERDWKTEEERHGNSKKSKSKMSVGNKIILWKDGTMKNLEIISFVCNKIYATVFFIDVSAQRYLKTNI